MISKITNKIICPKCNSQNIKKRGIRRTENRGKVQRYFCKDCRHSFILGNGFDKMKNAPQKITLCLDLFYRGVSTRKIQEHLQAFYPHNSSYSTIYRWIVKYARVIGKFTDNLKLNLGSEIQVDEIEYHRRKSHKAKQGTAINWFIDSVDTQTRFMVASDYFDSRSKKEIKEIMRKIKARAEQQPQTITTDGLLAYEDSVKKTWGYNNKTHKYNIMHNKVNASKGEGFNYPIERVHNNMRARTKTFRGFHGSVESAKAIMKGLEIYYNFITKHQAIDKCPYELACPELKEKLNGANKWLSLIKLSKR